MAPKSPKVEASAAASKLLKQRTEFRAQLAVSGLKALKKSNSQFESLGCVGYHPQQERLEAVVYVNEPFGYSGGICSNGSLEYVRFYLSYDDGASWTDLGVSAFTAYDIPDAAGSARLEYAVSLEIDPSRAFCFFEKIAKVRAILSWNSEPPADSPDHVPHWGDIHDTYIQIDPFKLFVVDDLLNALDVSIPKQLAPSIDPAAPIQAAEPKELTALELKKIYKKEVEPKRFAFKDIQQFISSPASQEILAPPGAKGLFAELDIDIKDILTTITGDGNTSYEELECVGLNPRQDRLAGVVRIKRASGFSGGLCTTGSKEYVAFWADFDENGVWEYVGTAEVNVYDIKSIPDAGLEYAVSLPIDLAKHRQPCGKGPKVVRVRAILSWNAPPPPFNPNYVPVWGNREETLVHIYPGPEVGTGPSAVMSIVGGIPVSMISNFNGMTTSDAVFALNGVPADSLGRACPFGSRVVVQGPQFPGYQYRVQTRKFELGTGWSGWSTVNKAIQVVDLNGLVSTVAPDPTTGLFPYLNFIDNINNTLAWWDSTGDELAEIRLEIFDMAGNPVPGAVPDVQRVQLDNTWPEASIEITTGAGDCGKFSIGATLAGNFVARDKYFGRYSLVVKPNVNPAGVGVPSPSSGTVQTAVAPGDAWTLDTTGMKACGYIIEVHAWDRAIVNSIAVRHHRPDSAGFCLE